MGKNKSFLAFKASNCRMEKMKAFSLVELLVTLIILSLIIAAFMPLITKKMKANDITVGSFGNNAIKVKRNVTKQDCDKYNTLYISADMNDGIKPICVTKWNVGDNVGNGGVPIFGDVKKLEVGDTCTDEGNCCWQGDTAGDCGYTGNGNSTYSGCGRTACQFRAASISCQNYAPEGTIAGQWRLPNTHELTGWSKNLKSLQFKKGLDGLQLCDGGTTPTDSVQCRAQKTGCISSSTNTSCYVYNVLSQDGINTLWLANKSVEIRVKKEDTPHSARCVLDSVYDIDTIEDIVGKTDIELSNDCNDGCALCSKDKCYACKQGYELNNGKCVSHCLTMNNGICVSCEKDYALLHGKCLACNPSNGFIKVGNLCVMQYNIGDGYYKESWGGVQRCIAGQDCAVENGNSPSATKDNLTPTCWQGKTAADGCNANFGGYDACSRTACNWAAGNQICTNIGWRLPTLDELKSFTNETYSGKTAFESGNGSLMFCDDSKDSTNHPLCSSSNLVCSGAYGSYCHLSHVWSSTFHTPSIIVWDVSLSGDKLVNWTFYLGYAFSARCVKDL